MVGGMPWQLVMVMEERFEHVYVLKVRVSGSKNINFMHKGSCNIQIIFFYGFARLAIHRHDVSSPISPITNSSIW